MKQERQITGLAGHIHRPMPFLEQHFTSTSDGYRTLGIGIVKYRWGHCASEAFLCMALVVELWWWRYQLTLKTYRPFPLYPI